jgi:hypothetical protein
VESAVINQLTAPANYKVSESLRSTHGQDGAVILDVAQGRMFSLNRVGARMLELMKSGAGEAEIVTVIGQEFEATRETVARDLGEFIATLGRHNLIDLRSRDRSAKPTI